MKKSYLPLSVCLSLQIILENTKSVLAFERSVNLRSKNYGGMLRLEKYSAEGILLPSKSSKVNDGIIFDRELQNDDACPVELCPLELRNNDNCEARCNIQICGFDNQDCDGLNDNQGGFLTFVFYGIIAIAGLMLVGGLCRGIWTTYSPYLGMTPFERLQVALGFRTREDITGEPDDQQENHDGTEEDEEEGEDRVAIASTVRVAEEFRRAAAANEGELLDDNDDGEEEGEILPVANRASVASSALLTAEEFRLSGSIAELQRRATGQSLELSRQEVAQTEADQGIRIEPNQVQVEIDLRNENDDALEDDNDSSTDQRRDTRMGDI